MARKKVRLAYIENDTARRVTYKKRVKGLVKKTQELSVLCGVDACAVVYGPYEKSPVVWPSSEPEARRILMEFKRKPEMDQSQRRFTQLTFLKQSVAKAEERLGKLKRRNRELEVENLMVDLLGGGTSLEQVPLRDMGDLLWVIDDKIRSIQHRIGVLDGTSNNNTDLGGGVVATTPSSGNEAGGIGIGIGAGAGVGVGVGVPPPNYHYHPYQPHAGGEMMMMMGGGVGNNMVCERRGVWDMEAGPSNRVMNGNNEWHFEGSSS